MKLSKKRKLLILDRMTELVGRPYGWTKGAWKKKSAKAEDGFSYCLLGAAEQAYEDVTGRKSKTSGADVAAELSIVALIEAKTGQRMWDPGSTVFKFNDAKKTKKKDVLAILNEKREELASS